MFFKFLSTPAVSSDEQMVARYKATADQEILAALFEKYIHLVYGVCLKYLQDRPAAQDATMQVYEKLMVELPRHDIANFKSWLHVLTKNHCLMKLRTSSTRQEKLKKASKNHEIFMESSYELHPDTDDNMVDNLDALKRCIEKLKEEQKACITLFYLEERCYREIVDITSFELKKVKSYIQNGRRNLKQCIENGR